MHPTLSWERRACDRPLASEERNAAWLRWATVEEANLRAALARLADRDDAVGVLGIATAMGWYWHFQMSQQEGRQWLEWSLAHTAKQATLLRAVAYAELAWILWGQGHYERAHQHAEASRAIAVQLQDPETIASAADALGSIALSQYT